MSDSVIEITNLGKYKKDICQEYLTENGKCSSQIHCKFANGAVELRDDKESLDDYLKRYTALHP